MTDSARHPLWILLVVLAALVHRAGAQQPSIRVDRSVKDVCYTLAPFTVVIRVEQTGAEINSDTPIFDATDEFEISDPVFMGGSSSVQSLVAGRLSREVKYHAVFQFQFTALREGDLTIPSATITIDGQQYRTNPEALRAMAPPAADFATLSIGPREIIAYVGQAIPIDVTFESSREPSTLSLASDHLPSGVVALPRQRRAGAGERAQPFTIFGADGAAFTQTGHPGLAFVEPLILLADEPGKHTVGPLSFVLDFDRERLPPDRHIVTSAPLSLEVHPLPAEGRPDAFNGIVGPCTIEAAISTPTARVGDPLTLTIRMTADLPPSRVPAPRLDLQESIADQFRLSSEGWVDVGVSGQSRLYSMTIRPQKAGTTELPAINVHWFDPESGTYKVSSSRPLPMKVETSREVTAADAIGRGAAPITRESIPDSAPRVGANRTGSDRLANYAPDFVAAWSSPWRPAVLVAPALAWSVAAGVGAFIRRRDPDSLRRARLVRSAMSHARRAKGDPRRGGRAARCFVAAYGGVEPDAVTSADALHLGLPTDDPHTAALLDALRQSEAAAYHGSASPMAATNLHAALRALHRRLKAQSGGAA